MSDGKSIDRDELQRRTKVFALRVMKLTDALPSTTAGREIGKQVLRSAMCTSSNYRAARRARSRKEFASKIGVVVEEIDESEHWLDMIIGGGLIDKDRVESLHDESKQLLAIFSKTRRTARASKQGPKSDRATKSPNRHSTKSPNESSSQ